MKLFSSPTSPYTRKVRMTALEKGLELEIITANPFEENPGLKAANPLGAVPTLVTDEGISLYDSPVICAYLDSLKPEPALIPEGSSRWLILRGEALCDGITDAAFATVMEGRRPEPQQSPYWKERWASAIGRSVNLIEIELSLFTGKLSIAQLALGSALGYLDFRLSYLNWRESNPETAKWFEDFSNRASMTATKPE